MCAVDFELPTFYTVVFPKARKPHRCIDCSGGISAGSRYEQCSGMWEREILRMRRCLRCHEVAEAMDAIGCSWTYGDLMTEATEALYEHREAPPEAYGRLAGLVVARRLEAPELDF